MTDLLETALAMVLLQFAFIFLSLLQDILNDSLLVIQITLLPKQTKQGKK